MKYLKPGSEILSQEMANVEQESKALLESRIMALQDRLREIPAQNPVLQAELLTEKGRTLLELGRKAEAWQSAREAFELCIAAEAWAQAVEASEVLFLSEQPESLVALGHGIWIAVTYPVDPELTVAMLQHVVEETPDDSDGAAVAAATAHYVVDLRASGQAKEDLTLFTGRLLATVARRHSGVTEQTDFEAWVERLELDDPAKFLVRLRNVVDVLVQDEWWFDREALQQKLPVN